MLFRLLVLFSVCLWPTSVAANSIQVKLTNDKGEAISGAVVVFEPSSDIGAKVENIPPHTINQKNLAFDPFISLVPVESKVTFKNEDSLLHHVFSFSKAKRFDLKLFDASAPQDVLFDVPGIVSVGCNIHDGMIAYIFVSNSPFANQTGRDGHATLENLPDVKGTLTVWHPLMKGKGNAIRKEIASTSSLAPFELSAKFRRGIRTSGSY